MARQASIAVENSFIKGLITEATALNFPENACTDTDNCVFDIIGSVERRLGLAQEAVNPLDGDGITTDIDRSFVAMSQYKWKNVGGNGDINVLVVQAGRNVYFFRSGRTAVGSGIIADTVDLTDFSTADDTTIDLNEATYSNNSEKLIITHPFVDPVVVTYDTATDTIATDSLTLKIRDFEGDVADALAVRQRPTASSASMTVNHKYNLYNQGWRDTELTTWDTARTDMPSNADVWWTYKVPTVSGATTLDQFSTAEIPNHETGNSPAPKGHFILTVWDKARDAATTNAVATSESVTALSGVTSTTAGDARPSVSAFFAGRIFYSGIAAAGYSSDIYFSQIIERADQFEKCYQDNDPTAEDLHDLLPTDGGVIKIPEAGKVVHLFPMTGFLIVFATNGIWAITGSTGLGFTANDYVVQKLSTFNSISASSFVDVAGIPMWWNLDGIFTLSAEQGSSIPTVKSLTLGTIQTFYDNIPPENKTYARGFYHPTDKVVQWIFNKDTVEGGLEQRYNFNNILNFNTISTAWYPWSFEDSNFINGITVLDGVQGFTTNNNVVVGALNVVVGASTVGTLTFSETDAVGPVFKYTTTFYDAGWHTFFSESRSFDYLDWDQEDSYSSYFITGYKLRGQGILDQQSTWIELYNDIPSPDSAFIVPHKYTFQAGFDYPNFTDASTFLNIPQTVVKDDTNIFTGNRRRKIKGLKRLKVRGHGKAMQFKVSSVGTSPFRLDGWITFDTKNSIP